MKKIVTFGLTIQYNLGCPSILHGVYNLLEEIYGNGFEMINVQIGEIPPTIQMEEYKFKTLFMKPIDNKKKLNSLLFKKKYSADAGYTSYNSVLSIIKSADAVIDLYGIQFCDSLETIDFKRVVSPLRMILRNDFAYYAKKHNIRSIKNSASYGPIETEYNIQYAKLAARYFYNCMVAREKESLRQIGPYCKRTELLYSPDTGNLMRCSHTVTFEEPTVGISTSHQIIKQWKNPEDYIQCVVNLCKYIDKEIGAKVLLIPNECDYHTAYSDLNVCEDIKELLDECDISSHILPVREMSALEIKNHISGCDVMVASRYHSCVASLSAGVPLLVIGWHYKYLELMKLYKQDRWILSQNDCDSNKLINLFKELWNSKDDCRVQIKSSFIDVRNEIIKNGRKMLKENTSD